MNALATARAVLVVLDRDERRLGAADESRYREGVGVTLLEVIQRAVHEVLPHLLPRALVAQVEGQALPSTGSTRQRAIASAAVSSPSESPTSRAPRPGTPPRAFRAGGAGRDSIPMRADPGEAAVVQFVADVQRQLQVQSVGVGIADRYVEARRAMRARPGEDVQNRCRQRPDGARQGRFNNVDVTSQSQ